jgi:GTP cyclohydrolase II
MDNLGNWCYLPTSMGLFRMYDTSDEEVRVISYGDINAQSDEPLIRIHSSCLASEVFGAQDCDCADQLHESMKLMATEEGGIIVHLHQEGRGQGLSLKIRAVHLMDAKKIDTVESFELLGIEQDVRTYHPAVRLLNLLGVTVVRLISNNPRKRAFLEAHGIEVKPVQTHPNIRPENVEYLHSKNKKLGHKLPLGQKTETTEDVRFYHSDQPGGYLSNFSKHSIFVDGIIWDTVEHYYQANKFADIVLQNRIRQAASPTLAKSLAKENKSKQIENWDIQKENVMLKALSAKFSQHPELRELLTQTGQRRIVEFTSSDMYWGESKDGVGKNRLGQLLMEIRSNFQHHR